jgi:hypothetical protein
MEPTFVAEFAAGKSLRIYRDDTLVDQLSLSGTGAAVMVLRRCIAAVKAQLAVEAREKARLSHIAARSAGIRKSLRVESQTGTAPRPRNSIGFKCSNEICNFGDMVSGGQA